MKIHLCTVGKGTGIYNEILNGLKCHKDVNLVNNLEEADYIIYNSCDKNFDNFMKIHKHKFRNFDYNCKKYQEYLKYKDYKNSKKEIILDWTDYPKYKLCATTELFKNVYLYFKRMCVYRKKNKSFHFINYERPIIPLPFAIRQDTINYINSLKKPFKRTFDISCLFDGKHRGYRREIVNFLRNTDLNYKIHVGTIKRSKKFYHKVNCAYVNQLLKSKIIVTSNPKNHEGDYRLYEALASGALVFCDQMLTPINHPFIHKKHLIFYKMKNLKKLLKYYLEHEEERETIAKEGKEFALKYHTFVYRVEEIVSNIKL